MAVILQKDRVYRLSFGPSIKKGQWYLGVLCHSCAKPILVLEDKTNGNPSKFLGEGKFSIPCRGCDDDSLYSAGEMKPFKATFSAKSFRELRPNPSGSPRQPLLPKYKGAKISFGIGALEQRAEAAAIISRCVAYWTYVEASTARLLATVMKATTEPAVAVYLSLKNNTAKHDALEAAAEFTLDDDDTLLFQAIMAYRSTVEKARNALAHGIFGISNKIPTGVIWVNTTTYTQHQAYVDLQGISDDQSAALYNKCFVYQVGDLETIARDIENLDVQISAFTGYLLADDPAFRATRYPQLCAEPNVQRELQTLLQKRSQAGRQ